MPSGQNGGIVGLRKQFQVDTGGRRNEAPLTYEQRNEAWDAARKQGYTRDIGFSDTQNTAFLGFKESDDCLLIIGTDAYPAKNGTSANERISLNGAMAHEIIGHCGAWKRGTTQDDPVLEEVQASLRASLFGIGLSDSERADLRQDAMDRLTAAGLRFEDVETKLDIKEA